VGISIAVQEAIDGKKTSKQALDDAAQAPVPETGERGVLQVENPEGTGAGGGRRRLLMVKAA